MGKHGWRQADLARAANMNRAVINKLIWGQCQPRHTTLEAISRAFALPIEVTYRAAGLLSPRTDYDEAVEEAIHLLRNIKDIRRQETAIQILRVLAKEEVNEQPS
jgi:transcriptional regulator with XRE-family HTH domain